MPSASRPDLSIITVSHGHWDDLRVGVPTWLSDSHRTTRELIVVDNTGTDGVEAGMRELAPGARVIVNERPRGFAANCNLALEHAEGRYVVLLNPDVRAEPGALDRLVEFMDAHPQVGIAGPKLLNPDGTLQYSCRRFSTPFLFALRGLGLERWLEASSAQRRVLMQDESHDRAMDVDWIFGAAMIARPRAIEDVGPLDPAYFLYCEDQDWCYRMWARGWEVFYVPESIMLHVHHRASASSLLSRWKWVHARSKLRMFWKQGVSGRRPSPLRAAKVAKVAAEGGR